MTSQSPKSITPIECVLQDQFECTNPTKKESTKEIQLYYWYLYYTKFGCFNAWSKISANIPSSSPTLIKNMFYTNAKTTLRKIAKCKRYFEDKEDKIRRAFFVYCARKYLLQPTKGKRNYFQKLIIDSNFSFDIVSRYASDININWSYEDLLTEIKILITAQPKHDPLAQVNGSEITLPISTDKKLPLINMSAFNASNKLSFEEKNTIMYYLWYPRSQQLSEGSP